MSINEINAEAKESLRKYFKKIFISEEIGYQKPKIEFFDFCFKHIKNKFLIPSCDKS